MIDGWVVAGALVVGLGLFGVLHAALRDRLQWLMVVLLAALAYMLISLGPASGNAGVGLNALRWGLFVLTLAAFVRFRWLGRSGGR